MAPLALLLLQLLFFYPDLYASGSGQQENYSIYEIARHWAEWDGKLERYFEGKEDIPSLVESLNGFSRELNSFIQSKSLQYYISGHFSFRERGEKIIGMVGEIRLALETDQPETAVLYALETDRLLMGWQYRDAKLTDSINMRYFYQFFLFSLMIITLVLFIWLLCHALMASRIREQESQAFSREIILGQERERKRISRELHDTVAQELRYLGMKLTRIYRETAKNDGKAISALCKEVIREQKTLADRVRSICRNLIPPDFQRQNLVDALNLLCTDFSERTGIKCVLSAEENLRFDSLSPDAQLQCFRIVQEALINIEKHAEASEASVVVRNGRAEKNPAPRGLPSLVICVSDDGKGFDEPPSSPAILAGAYDHFGIRGMYERTAMLNGSLEFLGEKGEGVLVKIMIPLESDFSLELPRPKAV
ncbi:MAG: sensor histidine kinase [Treponema sp.]|nr:sensor histidine kinase [Treponema sp.]